MKNWAKVGNSISGFPQIYKIGNVIQKRAKQIQKKKRPPVLTEPRTSVIDSTWRQGFLLNFLWILHTLQW